MDKVPRSRIALTLFEVEAEWIQSFGIKCDSKVRGGIGGGGMY